MEAVERNIVFDDQGNSVLILGKQFSKKKAKVVVLFEEEEEEPSEKIWLKIADQGKAFDFWDEPSENIYTLNDGIPYNKQNNEV